MKSDRPITTKNDADELLRKLTAREVKASTEDLVLAMLLAIATYLRILVEQNDRPENPGGLK